MDVNAEAVAALFDLSASGTMVHGHTHRPARHVSSIAGKECVRHVLPDWDCEAEPARGGWLALAADGRITRFEANGQVAP
jgi:UDP-2,3-diacylglucosamine hydrolase